MADEKSQSSRHGVVGQQTQQPCNIKLKTSTHLTGTHTQSWQHTTPNTYKLWQVLTVQVSQNDRLVRLSERCQPASIHRQSTCCASS